VRPCERSRGCDAGSAWEARIQRIGQRLIGVLIHCGKRSDRSAAEILLNGAIRNIDDSILNKYQYPWHIPKSFLDFIIYYDRNIKMERIYLAANELGELEAVMKQIKENEF
jgi:hypothetical protein